MSALGNENVRIRRICIKEYTLIDLSKIYNVSKFILKKRLKRFEEQIGQREGNSYNVKQVALIFSLVDLPSNILVVKA
ncbi:MAG TPA: hypothetical protein VLB84_17255 [Bacteroidia bacterium]|nr:hypothetical protein [Bacteroidia bacterium]